MAAKNENVMPAPDPERQAPKDYEVVLRVRRSGLSERATDEIRRRFEIELPLLFGDAAEIKQVRRARTRS